MEYYLTESIVLINDKMYYLEKNNKKELKKHNWHHYLKEYGWAKIPRKWITLLNKQIEKYEKNSLFGILDCEQDGDCFFHCLANALNEKNNYETQYDSNEIRNQISESIDEKVYETMINYYRIMDDADDFDEEWDPYGIESLEDFKHQIKKEGHNYWGDYILLQHVLHLFKINILILNSNDLKPSIYNTLNLYNNNYDTIALLYEDECHFQLIGHFNGSRIISYFRPNEVPHELLKLHGIQ